MPKTVRFTEDMLRASEREGEEALRKDLRKIRLSAIDQQDTSHDDDTVVEEEDTDVDVDSSEDMFFDFAKGKPGQRKMLFKKPNKAPDSSSRARDITPNSPPKGSCYICGSPEHWAADCPFKEQWQREQDEWKKKFQAKIRAGNSSAASSSKNSAATASEML